MCSPPSPHITIDDDDENSEKTSIYYCRKANGGSHEERLLFSVISVDGHLSFVL